MGKKKAGENQTAVKTEEIKPGRRPRICLKGKKEEKEQEKYFNEEDLNGCSDRLLHKVVQSRPTSKLRS